MKMVDAKVHKPRVPGYEILYQDNAVLAVSKDAGLAVLPGRGRTVSLAGLLEKEKRLKGIKPLMLHRIDADTSGLILFALTPEAQRHISEQFRTRTITKEYLALVRGTPLNESGSTDLPIGANPKDKTRMVIRGDEAKKARTKWTVAERFAGVTLLKVYPVTGRRHQIRVHLKAIGYPLAVDLLYGGTEIKLSEFKKYFKLGKEQEEKALIGRLTLHAHKLTFVHPATGAEMVLEAGLPKDFRATLEALRKWANRV